MQNIQHELYKILTLLGKHRNKEEHCSWMNVQAQLIQNVFQQTKFR